MCYEFHAETVHILVARIYDTELDICNVTNPSNREKLKLYTDWDPPDGATVN